MTQSLPAGTFTLDPDTTTVSVTVKKLGFITVTGALDVTAGRFVIGDDGAVGDVEVSVAASSYDTGNAKRDEHVRTADFLDADAHPSITFRAASVDGGAGGRFSAAGEVDVKGRTTPVTFEITDVESSDASGTFHATCTVDRNALGVDKMPGFVIGTTLTVDIAAAASAS